MTVGRTSGTGSAHTQGFGPGCGPEVADCRTFAVNWVDRLPAAVASVNFTTADGVTTTVPSAEGYVVFDYLGTAPANMEMSPMGPDRDPIVRVTWRRHVTTGSIVARPSRTA